MQIDARGKACPMPVVLTKRELDAGATALTVLVDNAVAVENLKRLAGTSGFDAVVRGEAPEFRLTLTKRADAAAQAAHAAPQKQDWALFVRNDAIGSGDRELGEALIKMFFFTLAAAEDPPGAILLLERGVFLAVENEQVIEHLRSLAARGVDILVCGTCLNHYQLHERLQVGTVSNMYDIFARMQAAAKVITL